MVGMYRMSNILYTYGTLRPKRQEFPVYYFVKGVLYDLGRFPGIKLGLANIVTLFALYALGPGQALLILMARCLLGAVFAGNMNALIFSVLGGVTAMAVMIGLSRLKGLSVYGVSVGGAAAHNCGQVAAAVLTLGSTAPLYYLPVLLGVSLFTGALTGLIAACLFRALAHTKLWGA